CANSRSGAHPSEPDRTTVQNLVGENRQERRSTAEKDSKHIEGDCSQDHLLTNDEPDSLHQAAPCISLGHGAMVPAANRQHEQEKPGRTDRINYINEGEPSSNNQESTNRGPDNRADLKHAAVPGDRVRKN